MLVDLSAAYDTIWHRGLTVKLLNMVKFIMQLVMNHRFDLHIGPTKSKRCLFKNGVPQGSVLALLLFNIYTSNLPPTTSKKYVYTDDVALATASRNFDVLEIMPSKDRELSHYFHNWQLKLNTSKTVTSVFHLDN